MRYSTGHRRATRNRIVQVAGRAFRESGVIGTGVDRIMQRAGLTHGGFYAHFQSKDELIAEACVAAFEGAVVNLGRISQGTSVPSRVRLLVDSYLSLRHRDNPGEGCILVAVAADMNRLGTQVRAAYARALARHLERVAEALRLGGAPEANRERAAQLMSSLVGTMIMARAMDDAEGSRVLLKFSRQRLRAEFSATSLPLAPAPRRPSNDFLVACTP